MIIKGYPIVRSNEESYNNYIGK